MSTPPRRRARAALAGLGAVALGVSLLPAAPAHADATDVVVNEVYARGGSANQPYNTKFVELTNPSGAAVDVDGLQLAYWSSSRTVDNPVATCDLSGSVAAGDFFVATMNSNGDTGAAVEADADCGNLSPSGTNGIVGLLADGEPVDLVGYGSAGVVEGTAAQYPGSNSVAGSIGRTEAADTDDNAADFTFFEEVTPGAANGDAGGEEPGPDPEPEQVSIADIQGTGPVTELSDPVTTRGVVTATYPTGGFNGIYVQTPGTGGTAKAEGDASDGIFVYQPQGLESLEIGQCLDITGTPGEFYDQTQLSKVTAVTEVADCDPVQPTELAELPATDAEREPYEGMSVLPAGDYTITNNYELNQYGSVGLAAGDEPLYQPTEKVLPGADAEAYEAENRTKEITLDDGASRDHLRTATDEPLPYLSHSTMRTGAGVDFTAPVIMDYRYESWNFQPTTDLGGAQPDFIEVADTRTDAPEVDGDVTVASFNVLNYFTDLGKDEDGCEAYEDREGNPVATDYCTVRGAWSQEAFDDQEAKLVAAINELDADVTGLMEIEDTYNIPQSAGFQTNPDLALEALVAALNEAAGEEKWAAAPAPQVWTNTDAIRTAFIYQVDSVEPAGPAMMLADPAFSNARHPLAQEFQTVGSDGDGHPGKGRGRDKDEDHPGKGKGPNKGDDRPGKGHGRDKGDGHPGKSHGRDKDRDRGGESFVAVVNHFKSKGSGVDDGTGQGNANPDRVAQAEALSTWVDGTEEWQDSPVLLLGDFNAYSKEDPLRTLEDDGWVNAPHAVGAEDPSYQFSGRLGSLDHIFGNEQAMGLVEDAAVWNINGDESIAFQYSRRNYNVTDFHQDNAFASSDHDPVKLGLNLGA